MNACMISYSFYEIDYRVRRYAEALVQSGAAVDVFALRREGAPRDEIINGMALHRVQRRQYNEKGPLSFLFRIVLFFLRMSCLMPWMQWRRRYRLIHIHNVPDFLVFTCIVPKLLGAKIILDIHDILPEFYCQKFGIDPRSWPARLLRLAEWLSVRFADHVIVANEIWRQKIIQRVHIPPERCTALLNYPDEVFFRTAADPPPPRDGFCMIYPGTISHLHGIDIAIQALGLIQGEAPDAHLDVYSSRTGGFPYFDSISQLVDELGLRGRVNFYPAVPHQQMSQVVKNATVGVVPKRGGVFASEAFSTKIFEFMASELPVVASRTTIDEFYFNDELIAFFEPENAQDLARRLLELYHRMEKRQALVGAAREFMRDKRWEQKKSIYYDIVEKLIGAPLQEEECKVGNHRLA